MKNFSIRLYKFCRLVLKRYYQDRCNRVAGALSYTTLLALAPLSAVLFAVFSVFPKFQAWLTTAQEFIYRNFVPASGEVIQQYLSSFAENTAGLTIWGTIFLVVTSLLLMSSIELTFNDIWHVKQTRRTLYRFLSYWALLTLVPILIGASFSISSYVVAKAMTGSESDSVFTILYSSFLRLLPVLLELIIFWLLYSVVPNIHVRWRHALIASLVTLLMFELAKSGFAYFIVHFAAYSTIYGALAALPIFFVWLYISWVVILLGAVIAASLPDWSNISVRTGEQPYQA